VTDTERRQEMFDKMYIGIVKQGKASYSIKHANCMYRGPDGLKCGIGHLIPDDKYIPYLEHFSIDELILNPSDFDTKCIISSLFLEQDSEFLDYAQQCHDEAYHESKDAGDTANDLFVEMYKERMQAVADKYNLTIPKVN